MKAPLIGIERHRIATDGQGVTTLVAFHGCPLRCRYCLNPQCFDEERKWRTVSPRELVEEVAVDDLYFVATGGGVTFGGGEPLLRSAFIAEFRRIANPAWNISLETSLNVDTRQLKEVMPYVDHYYIDIKDMNPDTYRQYTGKDNSLVLTNLNLLATDIPQEKITIRLPLIPAYNNSTAREASLKTLQSLGFTTFDLFNYIKP